MRKEEGRRIDWLHEQPESQEEAQQSLLNWLKEQEQADPRIDSLAPFLLKELKQERIRFDPDSNEWVQNDRWDPTPLRDYLSPLGELLHSSRVPQAYMSPNYSLGDMVQARRDWDTEYEPDFYVHDPTELRELEDVTKKREAEMASPYREREITPIQPHFDWHSIARNLWNGWQHPDSDDIDRVLEAAKGNGAVGEFGNVFNEYVARKREAHNERLEPDVLGYEPPSSGDYRDEGSGRTDWEAFDRAIDEWRKEHEDELNEHREDEWRNSPLGQVEDWVHTGLKDYWHPHEQWYLNEPFNPHPQLPGSEWGQGPDVTWGEDTPQGSPTPEVQQESTLFRNNPRPGDVRYSPEQTALIQRAYEEHTGNPLHEGYWDQSFNHGACYNYLTGVIGTGREDPNWAAFYNRLNEQVGEPTRSEDWVYSRTSSFVLPKGKQRPPHLDKHGKKCWCVFGPRGGKRTQEHLGKVVEAAQIDFLRKQKGFQSHEDRDMLMDIFKELGPERDRLFPWLFKEYKNGNLEINNIIRHTKERLVNSERAFDSGGPWKVNPDDPYGMQFDRNTPSNEDRWVKRHEGLVSQYNAYLKRGFDIVRPQDTEQGRKFTDLMGNNWYIEHSVADRLVQWLEDQKKRGKGINLNTKDPENDLGNVIQKMREWEIQKETENRPDYGRVIHSWPDGWSLRHIEDAEQAGVEGEDMGHCVGNDEYGHPQRISRGSEINLSLRDPYNYPHATLEIEPNQFKNLATGGVYDRTHPHYFDPEREEPVWDKAHLVQVQGKSDSIPTEEYRNRLQEWFDQHGINYDHNLTEQNPPWYAGGNDPDDDEDEDEEEYEPWWDSEYYGEPITTPNDYIDAIEHGEYDYPEEYQRACADAEEHGYDPPEFYPGDTNWDDVVSNIDTWKSERKPDGQIRGQYMFDPDRARELIRVAHSNGDWDPLMSAARDYLEYTHGWEGPGSVEWEHGDNADDHGRFWEHQVMANIHPETGELTAPEETRVIPGGYNWQREPVPYAETHWRREHERQQPPLLPENGDFDWGPGEAPLPEGIRRLIPQQAEGTETYWPYLQERLTHVKVDAPLYYRWTFSPNDGSVKLHSNDGHPAFIKTHGDLNDGQTVHGYGYRIKGGWRLTTYDHRPVEDPYIVAQVMRTLKDQSPVIERPDWEPVDYDYDQVHYGLPLPG